MFEEGDLTLIGVEVIPLEAEVGNLIIHGNTSAVGISFFGEDKADHFGIGDILTVVMRYVLVADALECVGSFDTLTCAGGIRTKVLSEATKFVGV